MLKYQILFLIILSQAAYSQSEKAISIPFDPDKWEFAEGRVEFFEYQGLKAVRLNENSGEMIYKDLEFKDGTIEFDVQVDQAMPFPTLYFRIQPHNAEHVYLRTGTANKKNAFDAVQYASIIDRVNLWDLQHEYQSSANIKINEWNHVKIVTSGKQLKVYINNPANPNLEVPCMEGNTEEGKIGIGTGFPGQTIFANLVVKPNETEGLSPLPGADITRHDTRYIRNWQVTEPAVLGYGQEANASIMPNEETQWQNIRAERRGLINISRKFGLSETRRVVWLKTNIHSEIAQALSINMGFSDEVWVYINKQPVYLDKNLYLQNMRKSPNGRISLDNCAFDIHLNKGDNEMLVAIANDFYGWGLIARLAHLEGISLQE